MLEQIIMFAPGLDKNKVYLFESQLLGNRETTSLLWEAPFESTESETRKQIMHYLGASLIYERCLTSFGDYRIGIIVTADQKKLVGIIDSLDYLLDIDFQAYCLRGNNRSLLADLMYKPLCISNPCFVWTCT